MDIEVLPLSVLLEHVGLEMLVTLLALEAEMVVVFVIDVLDDVFGLRFLVLVYGVVLVELGRVPVIAGSRHESRGEINAGSEMPEEVNVFHLFNNF